MTFFIQCPHCEQSIEIIKINCRIFRCGIIKQTFNQIDPHLPKDQCDKLHAEGVIYGCGKPFQIVQTGEEWRAIICDYI